MDRIEVNNNAIFAYRMARINIMKVLEEIEGKFNADLNASWETSETYDQASEETYSDYLMADEKIRLLNKLNLLDDSECSRISNYFRDIRIAFLEDKNRVTENKED